MDSCRMGHGVLGTASPLFLEQSMGGLDHTEAWQRVPMTAAGAQCTPQVQTGVRISI